MLTVLLEVTAEDGLQNVQTLLALEQGRVEALVDQSAGLVHEQAVGPFVSLPLIGEALSACGVKAWRPSGMAPICSPRVTL